MANEESYHQRRQLPPAKAINDEIYQRRQPSLVNTTSEEVSELMQLDSDDERSPTSSSDSFQRPRQQAMKVVSQKRKLEKNHLMKFKSAKNAQLKKVRQWDN